MVDVRIEWRFVRSCRAQGNLFGGDEVSPKIVTTKLSLFKKYTREFFYDFSIRQIRTIRLSILNNEVN